MKKNLLTATAVSVMAASSLMATESAVAGDVTVYGKANVSLQSMKVEDTTKAPDEVTQDNWELFSNASRLGVKGDAEINEKVKAIYQLEYETSFDDGDKSGQTFTQRNIFVGLNGSWGTMMTGMHDSPVKMIGEQVDIFSDYELGDIRNAVKGENRLKNMVMYRSPGMAGVSVDVMFAPGEEKGGDAAANKDDLDGPADQISASVKYKADFGLSVALGIDSEVADRDLTRLIVGYDAASWGISAMVQSADEVKLAGSEEEDGTILSGYYKVGNWKIKALAGQSDITEDAADDIALTQTVLGVDYSLGKNTKVYGYTAQLEKEIDNAADDSVKSTTLGVGLEHKF